MSDADANPESSRQARSRRRFLQGGAALGAALVAGAGRPIAGQTQPAPDDPSKVLGGPLRPYGERSPFEQNVRVIQAKPDERGEARSIRGRVRELGLADAMAGAWRDAKQVRCGPVPRAGSVGLTVIVTAPNPG